MLKNIAQLEAAAKNRTSEQKTTGTNSAGTSTTNATLRIKINKQSAMLKMIRSQLNAILYNEVVHSYRYNSIHLKAIQQQFVCIQNLHHQIWDSMETIDPTMYNYDAYIKVESQISTQISQLEDKAQQPETMVRPSSNQQTNAISPDSKLPHIKLPQFKGDYLKWRQFRGLFMEMVGRQRIPACQKMWYLKSSVTGEAETLIKHFTAAASSYEAAWQIINKRYENLRLLVTAVLNRLTTQSCHSGVSTEFARLRHQYRNLGSYNNASSH